MRLQIVCAGIGGRGVLLASTILIETAIGAGYKALASDEYGMSQRGGSVVSLVKVGDFASPLIGRESADLLLSFEESEFYRNLFFLKREGTAIVNTRKKGLEEAVANLAKERSIVCRLVDADGIAGEQGMIQASNMAILGFFSALSLDPFTFENMEETIRGRVPRKVLQKNVEVFRLGYESGRSAAQP